ncbi:hypothetical protein ALC62_04477 [Cyphomyrmex costatus]|uniref:Uncharacterized protein n=1 Tax=Cyphomyrmex costatus TaxID=456900 RepID=A0A151IK48_9HYME|nr:hypothetical protein ALC62_04477 [Cyphomyrmex costatus]
MLIQMFLSYPVLSQSKHNYMYPLYHRLKLVVLLTDNLQESKDDAVGRLLNVIELLLTQAKLAAAAIAFK